MLFSASAGGGVAGRQGRQRPLGNGGYQQILFLKCFAQLGTLFVRINMV